jgi:hypothetical protein
VNIDLSNITLYQLLLVTLAVAALDTLSGIFGAIQHGTFTLDLVAEYLKSHVLERVFPIIGLALLSQTIPGAGASIWAIALVGLGTYIAETVASVSSNITPAPAS